MDRYPAVVAAFAIALAATTGTAAAQELARLHVVDFALSADRTSVRVGEPFHVTVTARLGERLEALDNVTLPNLSGFEELGDERRCSATTGGTTCVETLTLDAPEAGDQTIGAATLSAIDARTARPSRFITGTLPLRVLPRARERATAVRDRLYGLAADVMRFALVALFVAVAGLALWRMRRSPRAAPAVAPAMAVPPLEEAPEFAELVAALAREPTRERVSALRRVLRARARAGAHETLSDLVARRAFPEVTAAAALSAVERAAFCEESQLPEAVREALPYLR